MEIRGVVLKCGGESYGPSRNDQFMCVYCVPTFRSSKHCAQSDSNLLWAYSTAAAIACRLERGSLRPGPLGT